MNDSISNSIKEEAAEWVLLLNESSHDDFPVREWREWMMLSAEHQRVFSSMLDLWGVADSVDFVPELYSKLEFNNSQALDQSPTLPGKALFGWSFNSSMVAAVFSVSVIAVLIASFDLIFTNKPSSLGFQGQYSTAKAEHRSIELPDGSLIDMGAETSLEVDFSERQRRIILHNGESYFQVAQDSQRPFLVFANRSVAKAVGTAFNIKRWLDKTTVSVAEGLVDITALDYSLVSLKQSSAKFPIGRPSSRLSLGQAVSIANDGRLSEMELVQPALQTAWKVGHLVFVNQPLETVVADLNRYSKRYIKITDSTISALHFTGTVQKENISDWLLSLPRVLDVKVYTENEQFWISPIVE